MSETAPPMRRISSLFLAIILVTLVLAVAALYQAVNAFRTGDFNAGINFAMIGATTLALSTYMLFQTRRKMQKFTIKMQRVATTILCQKCGFKTIRDFQRGDYIFKEAEECPKCNEKMLIASIYREAKEKES
jgi:DNA integrity scanning protein DisA with diadenylate cyclase activity